MLLPRLRKRVWMAFRIIFCISQFRLYCIVALLAGLSSQAGAANLQISPVMLNLDPVQRSAEIRLMNSGDSLLYGQVRVYLWQQKKGEDQLTATSDLVASPPIIKIAAHGEQIIRLVRSGSDRPPATALNAEQSYRILIDEIPTVRPSDSGVNIALRYSVPVFIGAAGQNGGDNHPDDVSLLDCRLYRDKEEDGWLLAIKNGGPRRAQFGATVLIDSTGQRHDISKGLLAYALAGSTRILTLKTLPASLPAGSVTAESHINGHLESLRVTVMPVAGLPVETVR